MSEPMVTERRRMQAIEYALRSRSISSNGMGGSVTPAAEIVLTEAAKYEAYLKYGA